MHIDTAYVAHYGGPAASAACSAAEDISRAFVVTYGTLPPRQASLACYVLSSADVAAAYERGHAIAVYDNALAETTDDAASTICALAVSRGELVLDADENPYTP